MLIQSRAITNDEVEIYRTSRYQVITIIPYVQNPKMNIYIFNQEELSAFLKVYNEVAEFIISIKQAEAMA